MQVPSTRLFQAGEVEAGAYLNSAVTSLGNFMLGKPVAQLYTTATTAIGAGATVVILFPNEVIDRDNGHSTSTNTDRYVAQTPGWYFVTSTVQFSATAGTNRFIWHSVNGTPYNGSFSSTSPGAAAAVTCTNASFMYLNVGDYVTTSVSSGTACSLAAIVSPAFPNTATMTVIWVSS
jgi:hypothetical protein